MDSGYGSRRSFFTDSSIARSRSASRTGRLVDASTTSNVSRAIPCGSVLIVASTTERFCEERLAVMRSSSPGRSGAITITAVREAITDASTCVGTGFSRRRAGRPFVAFFATGASCEPASEGSSETATGIECETPEPVSDEDETLSVSNLLSCISVIASFIQSASASPSKLSSGSFAKPPSSS